MIPATQQPVSSDAVLRVRRAPHVEWVEVEGEVIAWNGDSKELHRLDRIATMIFHLCDGEAPLARTVAELATAFDREAARIEADVLACAARLHRDGLVEGVHEG